MKNILSKLNSGNVNGTMRSKIVAGVALSVALGNSAFAATTIDSGSFNNFYDALVSWVQGSLGYVIALLGMLGTIIVYAFTHKGAVLFIGMLLSFFVGGVVGISKTMFSIGTGTFATT